MPEDVWPHDQEVEPDTFDDLLTLLLRRGTAHLIYRGQLDHDWPLECTLSRALREEARNGGPISEELMGSMVRDEDFTRHVARVESVHLRYFMEQAKGLRHPDLPARTDRLGWWELMQHHGAPTRLLDWTRSPFVALWFAFSGRPEGAGDAALWVFDTHRWPSPVREPGAAVGPGWDNFLDDRGWQNFRAESAIDDRHPAPVVIKPRVAVPRVVAQQSVLTLVPSIDAPAALSHFVLKTMSTRIRLCASWKQRVFDLCQGMGITRATLFRDLDSVGRELKDALTRNRPT